MASRTVPRTTSRATDDGPNLSESLWPEQPSRHARTGAVLPVASREEPVAKSFLSVLARPRRARRVDTSQRLTLAVDIVLAADEFLTPFLDTEGLYRVPGAAKDVQALLEGFISGALIDMPAGTSPHTVCSVVKRAFVDCGESLLPDALKPSLDALVKIQDDAAQTHYAHIVLSNLPPTHAAALGAVIQHLTHVVQHEQCNRMSASAVATCWAPAMLAGVQDPRELATRIPIVQTLVVLLIRQADKLFVEAAPVGAVGRHRALVAVPPLLEEAFAVIELHARGDDAVYEQISDAGVLDSVRELREQCRQGVLPFLRAMPASAVPVVTELVRTFLRDMRTPLVPFALQPQLWQTLSTCRQQRASIAAARTADASASVEADCETVVVRPRRAHVAAIFAPPDISGADASVTSPLNDGAQPALRERLRRASDTVCSPKMGRYSGSDGVGVMSVDSSVSEADVTQRAVEAMQRSLQTLSLQSVNTLRALCGHLQTLSSGSWASPDVLATRMVDSVFHLPSTPPRQSAETASATPGRRSTAAANAAHRRNSVAVLAFLIEHATEVFGADSRMPLSKPSAGRLRRASSSDAQLARLASRRILDVEPATPVPESLVRDPDAAAPEDCVAVEDGDVPAASKAVLRRGSDSEKTWKPVVIARRDEVARQAAADVAIKPQRAHRGVIVGVSVSPEAGLVPVTDEGPDEGPESGQLRASPTRPPRSTRAIRAQMFSFRSVPAETSVSCPSCATLLARIATLEKELQRASAELSSLRRDKRGAESQTNADLDDALDERDEDALRSAAAIVVDGYLVTSRASRSGFSNARGMAKR